VETEADLESAMEEFLRKQAEIESGKSCSHWLAPVGAQVVLQVQV
jgi:hypothetical protein